MKSLFTTALVALFLGQEA